LTLYEDELRDFIEENWALETEGITDADVAFTLTDANAKHPFKPQVFVYLIGFNRLQQAEDALYEFRFLVGVQLWNKTVFKTDSAQALHWSMVDHIKKMFDNNGKPSGWEYAHVESGSNDALGNGLLLEQNLITCVVKAVIAWV
jgi:hypothetical protein